MVHTPETSTLWGLREEFKASLANLVTDTLSQMKRFLQRTEVVVAKVQILIPTTTKKKRRKRKKNTNKKERKKKKREKIDG